MAAAFEQVKGWVRQITFLGRRCIVGVHEQEPRVLIGFTHKIIFDTEDFRVYVINAEAKGETHIFCMDLNRFLYPTLKLLAQKNSILVCDGAKSDYEESAMQYLN